MTKKAQVLAWRVELLQLENNHSPVLKISRSLQKKDLRESLEKAFCARFGFKRSGHARSFYQRCIGPLLLRDEVSKHDSHFDHCTYYQSGDGFAITSQPYNCVRQGELTGNSYDRLAEAKVFARKLGAKLLNSEEWSWHYPGHAASITFLFSRPVIVKMRKETRPLLRRFYAIPEPMGS
jgi:hypothetical protein